MIRLRPRTAVDIVTTGLLVFLAVAFLVPFYVVLRNSSADDQFLVRPDWAFWPDDPQLISNIGEALTNTRINVFRGLQVSAIVASVGMVGQLLIASMAGYALARVKFRYRRVVVIFVLLAFLIPPQAAFIPRFILIMRMGLVDTLAGIIVPSLFNAFAAIVYRQFFLDFPSELEASGRMDGLGYWGTWWRLGLPSARGVTAALAVITFFTEWNSFLWPLIVGQSERLWTIQVVMSSFVFNTTTVFHLVFAGTLLALLPIVALFIIMHRTMVRGVSLTTIGT